MCCSEHSASRELTLKSATSFFIFGFDANDRLFRSDPESMAPKPYHFVCIIKMSGACFVDHNLDGHIGQLES